MPTSTTKPGSHFRRDLLPPAQGFYQKELGRLSRPNGKGFAMCRCPFHDSKSGKSFSVHLESGGFHCFGCNASGGDVVSFVMLRDHVNFKTAAKALGAWRDEKLTAVERHFLAQKKEDQGRLEARVDSIAEAERKLRFEYREQIHTLERIQRETRAKLNDKSISKEDVEGCWHVLTLVQDELRDAIAAYYLLAFGTVGERFDFVLHPHERDSAIAAVLNRGTVRDDSGVVMEVCVS